MDSKFTFNIPTSIGDLELEFQGVKLSVLSITENSSDKKERLDNNLRDGNKLKENTFSQLKNYFDSSISVFSIPLAPQGTSFQRAVWHELSKIPPGETRTYGEIANKLNSSPRAVGNACRKNPIQIIIPCHRVISANGIGGYAGETEGNQLNIKRWLLNHEGVVL